ncbi:MAG: hypothetical protein IJL30_03255 [Clostridia bacterium]|nr:hypothetical protein [Clostridia bacterium]
MNGKHNESEKTAELIGVLSAISVVSKRLAGKLIMLESQKTANVDSDSNQCLKCALLNGIGKSKHRNYY